MRKVIVILISVLIVTASKGAPFRNLGFDEAMTNQIQFEGSTGTGFGPQEALLPGWQLFLGTNLFDPILFDTRFLGDGNNVELISNRYAWYYLFQVDGLFALNLDTAFSDRFSLVQKGDIPSETKYLSFRYRASPFKVSINGLSLSPLDQAGLQDANVPTSVFYDVSKFAGQTAELKLETIPIFMPSDGGSFYMIDSIAFQIPEASTVVLLALGAVCFYLRGTTLRWNK